MDYRAYRRRNAESVRELQKAGHHASETSLAGGYYDVNVPLEKGYHLSLAQDSDGQGSWAASVYHRDSGVSIDPHGKEYDAHPYYDLDLGHAHPKDTPQLVSRALQHYAPRIAKHAQEQRQNNRNLGPQFG